MTGQWEPREFAEGSIEIADRARERNKESAAWFALAYCALRLFALLVSSYLKRDR